MTPRTMPVLIAVACAVALALYALAPEAPTPGPAPAAEPASSRTGAAVDAGRAPAGGGLGVTTESDYDWPITGEPTVLRGFEPPANPWSAGHRGVDLQAPLGSEVRSAAEGVVAFAGGVVDRPVVSVDHPDGIRTTYEPVQPAVRAGDRVGSGDLIGHVAVGEDGPHCPGSCLHWGARIDSRTYIDPLLLLGLGEQPVRLYPDAGASTG